MSSKRYLKKICTPDVVLLTCFIESLVYPLMIFTYFYGFFEIEIYLTCSIGLVLVQHNSMYVLQTDYYIKFS